MERHQAHLCADESTLIKVNKRREKPVLLKIKATQMLFRRVQIFPL